MRSLIKRCQPVLSALKSAVPAAVRAGIVALLGSLHEGLMTLARRLDTGKPIPYLDRELPSDIAKLAEPEVYLCKFADHLAILDEIHLLVAKGRR